MAGKSLEPIAQADYESLQPQAPTTVTMVGPGPDNEPRLYDVPSENLQTALDAGWRHATDKDLAHEEKVKAKMAEIAGGPLGEGFGTGVNYFLNEAGAGIPGTVQHYTDTPEEKQARDRLYQKHTGYAWTGGALGLAGNLLATHGLGQLAEGAIRGTEGGARALEAVDKFEKAAPFVSKIGRGALTGGEFAIPQAATSLYYKDPETAAESMLWGMGLGAGLGTISHAASKVYDLGEGAVKGAFKPGGFLSPERLNAKADEMLAARAGITPAKANKLGTERLKAVANLVENDPFMKGKELGHETADALAEDAGEKLKTHWGDLDQILDNHPQASGLKPTPGGLSDEFVVQTLKDHPEFGIQGVTPENVSFAYAVPGTPLFENEVRELKKIAETIKDIGSKDGANEPIGMEELQKLKENIGSKTKYDTTSSPGVNSIRQEAYRFIKDKQMSIADQAYEQAGMTGRRADYEIQKNRYRIAQDLLKYGEKQYTPNNFGIPLGSQFSSTLGAVAGAHIGGMPGAGIGYGAMLIGKKILGHYLENAYFRSGSQVIRALADSEAITDMSNHFANHGTQAVQKAIGNSHNFILGSAKNLPYTTVNHPQLNPIKYFLGNGASGLSKEQQYNKVAEILTKAATDPSFSKDHYEAIRTMFGDNPQLAQLVTQKNQVAINFLYNALPKNPNPPRLFSKNDWTPSVKQMTDFANKLAIVQDPMYLMTKAQMGTLTQDDIKTAQYIYPKILGGLQNHITLMGSSPDAPSISHGMKMALEMITNQKILNPDGINHQSAYVGAAGPNAPAAPPSKRGRGQGHTLASMNWGGWQEKNKVTHLDKMPSMDTSVGRRDHRR